MRAMSGESAYFDVCVVCALAEEAEAFMKVLKQEHNVSFEQGFSVEKREYRYATIPNNQKEPLKVHLSWLPRYGPIDTALHVKSLLKEFNPRLVGMIGICAGDKREVKLGDLVFAERAFNIDTGKIVSGADGKAQHKYDTYTVSCAEDILQYARLFTKWQIPAANLLRPLSKHQQHDWLLNQLLNKTTPRIDDIDASELKKHAPLWKKIMQGLQAGPHPWLSQKRELIDESRVLELRFGDDDFPYEDPPAPVCHIKPMGSSSAVQGANPFDEIRVPVRGAVAIDMEGAAFYQAVVGFPAIRSLLVKGVCDYADNDKDDTYHEYASLLSATYMLSFIQEYVTQQLMPLPSGVPIYVQSSRTESISLPATAIPLENEADEAPDALNVFFSYAPEDDTFREGLEKHLAVLKHQGRIKCWYSGNITGGQDQGAESMRHLNAAQIILLLISPDFMASKFYSNEIKRAYERYKEGKARVIPILLRPTEGWKQTSFGGLMPLPKDGRPIDAWSKRDQAFYEVASGIRDVVDQLDRKS